MTPFRRDGHLSDLGLEHVLDGTPLDGSDAHLAACQACAARLAAAEAVELPVRMAPSMPSSVQDPPARGSAANRPWIAVGLAVAAVLLLVLAWPARRPVGADDGIRLRGDGLSLQVFRDAGDTSERLRDGDRVHPGDRLGFRVRTRDGGHLLVVGLDDADVPYVCYPQDQGGRAVQVGPSSGPRALPEAVRVDGSGTAERLHAVLCERPFDLEDVRDALIEGEVPEGCLVDVVTLVKP